MAVTKILSKSMRLDRLVRYVTNPDKTDDYVYTCFYNCDKDSAAKQMLDTKDRFSKRDGIQAFHIIQSFSIGEITPELAHQIGHEFIKEHLQGYEVVLGTHVDKGHIHNHIVLNSVSFMSGKKYHSTSQSYFREIRAISDRLCKEHGLSVIIEPHGKAMSYAEWKLKKAGVYTQRELFEFDFKEVFSIALNYTNFVQLMEDRGYTVRYDSKYPTFVPYGAKHGFRAKIDGVSLTADDIGERIRSDQEYNGNQQAVEDVVVKPREFIPYKAYGKQHGFMALVVSWMYVLGIIRSGKRTNYKVDPAEVKRFERYRRDEEYLRKHDIDTAEQLDAREAAINSRVDELTKSRIIWNSKKKRRKKLYQALSDSVYFADAAKLYAEGETGFEEEYAKYLDAEKRLEGIDRNELSREQSEVYDHIANINSELRGLRSELKIIKDIQGDVPHIDRELEESSKRYEEETKSSPTFNWNDYRDR